MDNSNLAFSTKSGQYPEQKAQPKPTNEWPRHPGFYWAQWRIASEGTTDGDELTPSTTWAVVELVDNNGESGTVEEFAVSVCGVEQTQWPDCFVWGPRVQDYKP